MRIRTLKSFLHDRNYSRGEEIDVSGPLARQFIRKGMAVALSEEPADAAEESKSEDGEKSAEKGSAETDKPGKPEKAK